MRETNKEITTCLDDGYSTTRLVTYEQPVIIHNPEDEFEAVLFLSEGEEMYGVGGLRTQGCFKQSLPKYPLISIITVVYNGEEFLEETILSVINQSYDNVEYIIIDGGSTDGTIGIIRKYEKQIDYWVSRLDNGIYDAMNTGVSVCTGDIIAFLNSDDWYCPSILQYVSNNIGKDYVACSITKVSSNGYRKTFVPQKINMTNYKAGVGMPFPHPGLFVHSYVFRDIGLFNLKYKIAADMEFVYRMLNSKYLGDSLTKLSTNFRIGGASSNFGAVFESMKIEYNAGAPVLLIVYSFILRTVATFSKRIFYFFTFV